MPSHHPNLAIRGGTVVNPDWMGPATVLVSGGQISAVQSEHEALPGSVDRVVDATGQLVVPGGVDPHCHINMTLGEFTTLDGYAEATIAALHGGTTTVIDFAIPTQGQPPAEAALERRKMAEDARCSTALHGCVVDWDPSVPDQLREMAASGVRTIKLFTTYKGQVMAEPDTVLRVMRVLADIGGLAYVHAEADHLVRDAQMRMADSGDVGAGHHPATRPETAEAAAVAEVLATAETLGVGVYFVHQTIAEAVWLVREARSRGVAAYTETCPHYLLLDSSYYSRQDPERYVCCPPLRQVAETEALRRLVHAGEVDTIGSDHCCFDTTQKLKYAHDVREMPNGLPGVETRLPVIFSRLVVKEGLSPQRFVALTSTNPARLNGLFPRKGILAPGSDADIVLVDPHERRVISAAANLHMATDYSPYESHPVTGWPTTVIVNGKVVLDGGQFIDPGPTGPALHALPLSNRLIC